MICTFQTSISFSGVATVVDMKAIFDSLAGLGLCAGSGSPLHSYAFLAVFKMLGYRSWQVFHSKALLKLRLGFGMLVAMTSPYK
jgi:hypothetical protein